MQRLSEQTCTFFEIFTSIPLFSPQTPFWRNFWSAPAVSVDHVTATVLLIWTVFLFLACKGRRRGDPIAWSQIVIIIWDHVIYNIVVCIYFNSLFVKLYYFMFIQKTLPFISLHGRVVPLCLILEQTVPLTDCTQIWSGEQDTVRHQNPFIQQQSGGWI